MTEDVNPTLSETLRCSTCGANSKAVWSVLGEIKVCKNCGAVRDA